jgi:hypothetical protein
MTRNPHFGKGILTFVRMTNSFRWLTEFNSALSPDSKKITPEATLTVFKHFSFSFLFISLSLLFGLF